MKNNKILKFITFGLLLAPFVVLIFVGTPGCKKDDSKSTPDSVSTKDANGLQSVITISNGTLVNGQMPSTSTTNAPTIDGSQSSIQFNPGTQFQLPFTFTSTTPWKYIYVYVVGATNGYFKITNPSPGTTTSGTVILPITIPDYVLYGDFTIVYCFEDQNGNVSNQIYTYVSLTAPKTCTDATMYGSEGLTATNVDLGTKSGTVTLNYDTYSIPDRIDIYQGSTWLTGTGTNPNAPVPPLCNCSNPLPGFIGAAGTLTINYDPSKGHMITVYVSGCLGSGTAWDWSLSCPQ